MKEYKIDGKSVEQYWTDKIAKHLVGRKIVKVKWLSATETEEIYGWDQQPCEIYLDDGTILTPRSDDEGNESGAIGTNLIDLPIIPTFREDV